MRRQQHQNCCLEGCAWKFTYAFCHWNSSSSSDCTLHVKSDVLLNMFWSSVCPWKWSRSSCMNWRQKHLQMLSDSCLGICTQSRLRLWPPPAWHIFHHQIWLNYHWGMEPVAEYCSILCSATCISWRTHWLHWLFSWTVTILGRFHHAPMPINSKPHNQCTVEGPPHNQKVHC